MTSKRPQPPSYDDSKILADKVNNAVGSGRFILIQTLFLFCYILWNCFAPKDLRFDPFPFILCNLLLSFQAGYTGPFIVWSQNRAATRDRLVMTYIQDMVALIEKDVETDKRTERKMEKEIRSLNAKMDHILAALKHLEGERAKGRED